MFRDVMFKFYISQCDKSKTECGNQVHFNSGILIQMIQGNQIYTTTHMNDHDTINFSTHTKSRDIYNINLPSPEKTN